MLTPALQVHTMPPQHINVNFNLMSLNYINYFQTIALYIESNLPICINFIVHTNTYLTSAFLVYLLIHISLKNIHNIAPEDIFFFKTV